MSYATATADQGDGVHLRLGHAQDNQLVRCLHLSGIEAYAGAQASALRHRLERWPVVPWSQTGSSSGPPRISGDTPAMVNWFSTCMLEPAWELQG